MNLQDLSARLTATLSHHPEVRFAYLFGSQARGGAGPKSDVDVAIALSPDTAIARVWMDVSADLARALAPREVDCILLNASPPGLRFVVVRDGRVVLERDAAARRAFEVATRREYWDLEPWRRRHDAALLLRLKDGTYGTRAGADRAVAPR